ncbi:hypothetical protein E8L90_08095 [Brevibacillus antibioticus]|uniref:Uncharacterized protein n=1 Tax=Brevibacillus antibioticus TaxID=2570228 RepID=A0A4U2Y4K3_9BACL|nr:hypothetical protein [Brevibacillus antibioticus]TKI55408.1 hypothetical protein E8L90_08095 [Brevibacillus antibioticus]
MINLGEYPYNKESLRELLERSRTKTLSHEEVAMWCFLYWSSWRSDEDDLFNKTDEMTIDIVMEIGEFWVNKPECGAQVIIFGEEQIDVWIDRLHWD